MSQKKKKAARSRGSAEVARRVHTAKVAGSIPAPATELVPINRLKLDPRNVRKHGPENLAAIQASLKQFGQQRPILAMRDRTVIAGNGTLEAARALGWTEIEVRWTDLKGAEARAYAIADNRTAELAEWDLVGLKDALQELDVGDFDMDCTGFSEDDLEEMMTAKVPPVTEDDLPENVKTRCKKGDLWQLGDHRLLCGNSTKAEDVARVMDGKKATLLFTDPPYGVNIGAKNRMLNSFQKAGRNLTDIVDDGLKEGDLRAMLLAAFTLARTVCADDCAVFVCSPQGGSLGLMMMMMQEAGLTVRHIVNWQKNAPTFSMGRLDYEYQHEPILFTWIKTHKRIKGGPFQTSLWPVDKPRASPEHPTMKPVALPANAILNHTESGDIILDNFLGSGTTLIAAEQTDRRCFGLEITPRYCDVILARWEALTGKKAVKSVG